MTGSPFAALFLAVLLGVTAAQVWLIVRQMRHLRHHRGGVPAMFQGRLSADEHARASDYQRARLRLDAVEAVAGALLLLALTWGGVVGGVVVWLREGMAWPVAAGTAAVVAVAAFAGLLDVAFGAWRTFRVEVRFGFNRTTPRLFLVDALKQAAVTGFLLALLGVAFLTLMTRAGSLWWLYAWGVWLVVTVALTWAYPKWIAPLFNRFQPLADPELRQRVSALMSRCGFALRGVLVMDASRRTAHGSAYFTGLGSAKRVVLFDTLLTSLEPDETEAVLAHELGHFRLGHIRNGVLVAAAAALAGLALLDWLATEAWFFTALGVDRPSAAAALILFALVAPVFAFPLRPLAAAWSRRREVAADRFADRHSDGAALGRALVKLYRDNAAALTADPLYARFYHSHPLPAERIARLQGTG